MGYSPDWIRMAKRSMVSILPRFNATRMVEEYLSKFYLPASHEGRRYRDDAFAAAKEVAAWKARMRAAWPGVQLRRLDKPAERLQFGQPLRIELGVKLNGLVPDDVMVEMLMSSPDHDAHETPRQRHRFAPEGKEIAAGEQRFVVELTPEFCGRVDYRIRAYPWHELLAHPFELGLMIWL